MEDSSEFVYLLRNRLQHQNKYWLDTRLIHHILQDVDLTSDIITKPIAPRQSFVVLRL